MGNGSEQKRSVATWWAMAGCCRLVVEVVVVSARCTWPTFYRSVLFKQRSSGKRRSGLWWPGAAKAFRVARSDSPNFFFPPPALFFFDYFDFFGAGLVASE